MAEERKGDTKTVEQLRVIYNDARERCQWLSDQWVDAETEREKVQSELMDAIRGMEMGNG